MNVAPYAIFLGSFLAFFIQPLVGRTLLPVFGGSAAVWVTCLVMFQVLLLAGYGYAFIPARGGRRAHLALLALAAGLAATVPVWKGPVLAKAAQLAPVPGVAAAVIILTGLVSLVLSANATVVQSWRGGGREVYRLYSVSNVGSLAGLLAYPLAVEPFVPLAAQWAALGGATLLYALLVAQIRPVPDSPRAPAAEAAVSHRTPPGTLALWMALPCVSCALLTATTTFLTTDFSPLPLMWAILLSAFLLSYVIGFSRLGERLLPLWTALSVPTLAFVGWSLLPKPNSLLRFGSSLAAAMLLLLVVCSALHAVLCRSRPETGRLPLFYFCTSLGGVVGGILTGVVAPWAFGWLAEFPLALVAACGLLALGLLRMRGGGEARLLRNAGLAALGALAAFIPFASLLGEANGQRRLWRARGFYGVVSVRNDLVRYANGTTRDIRVFCHGKTVHGTQLPDFPAKPTLYYSLNGGGIAFESYAPRKEGRPIRAGFVGMGVGTLAAYGRPGDVFRFYEISPEAIQAATATNLFTFLSASKAKVEIVAGDARLELARDRKRGIPPFDILVVDAYSGDSVPTHLITREAFALYRSMMKPGGLLALHLSNWHMNLWPLAKAAAREFGWQATGSYSGQVLGEFAEETGWAFLTDGPFIPHMPTCCRQVDWSKVSDRPLLGDECGSLLPCIEFNYAPPCQEDELLL